MQTKNGFTKLSKNNHITKYDPKGNTKELQNPPIVINNCHKHQGYKRTPKFTPNNYTQLITFYYPLTKYIPHYCC